MKIDLEIFAAAGHSLYQTSNGSVHTHFLKICLQLTVINDVRFREFKNNLSDFDKGAKQLMDDGRQKKHFSSKIQKVCSLPILAQNVANSAQVLSWTYCLIKNWLRRSNLLKGPR